MSVSPFSERNYLDPAYRALRTNRHTFVWTSEDAYYLFDDIEDPHQLHNLADAPAAAAVQAELKKLLARQLEKIGAPFRAGEYYLEKWKYAVDEFGNVPYSR